MVVYSFAFWEEISNISTHKNSQVRRYLLMRIPSYTVNEVFLSAKVSQNNIHCMSAQLFPCSRWALSPSAEGAPLAPPWVVGQLLSASSVHWSSLLVQQSPASAVQSEHPWNTVQRSIELQIWVHVTNRSSFFGGWAGKSNPSANPDLPNSLSKTFSLGDGSTRGVESMMLSSSWETACNWTCLASSISISWPGRRKLGGSWRHDQLNNYHKPRQTRATNWIQDWDLDKVLEILHLASFMEVLSQSIPGSQSTRNSEIKNNIIKLTPDTVY